MPNPLMQEFHSYTPTGDCLSFWWLGQLGYLVKTPKAALCFDPFLRPGKTRTVPPLLAPEDLTGIDYVFGSHDHGDHIDHYAWSGIAAASPQARFVVPEKLVEKLSAEFAIPLSRFVGLDEGKTYRDEEKDLTLRGIAAAHELLNPDPVTGLHDAISFLVDAGGLRLYHSGDTCKYEGLETKLISYQPIDLMFLPINGRDAVRYTGNCIGNMNFAEAVDLVGAVAPGLAVPGHYEMFAMNSEDPARFTDYLNAKYPGRKYWVGAHGVLVEVTGR